jgi:hypothetical protein
MLWVVGFAFVLYVILVHVFTRGRHFIIDEEKLTKDWERVIAARGGARSLRPPSATS